MTAFLSRLAERARSKLDPGQARAERHDVWTPDGWRLPIRRLEGSRSQSVVVLCHGLGGNARSFDLPGTLGPYLAARGFDVFLVELRGGRQSRPPDERERHAVGLDDWITDAGTVAGAVAAIAGTSRLAWVGHSLGGYVALAAAWSQPMPHAIVGIGSTLFFQGNVQLARTLAMASRLGATLGGGRLVPQATLGALEAPIMGRVALPPWLDWVSPPGIDGARTRQLHALAIEDMSLTIVDELLDLATSAHGAPLRARDRERAATLPADVMLVCGSADRWAPPSSVEQTAELLAARSIAGGAPRTVVQKLAGATGYSDAYGHAALLLGRHSERDVYRPIAEFLSR